MKSFLSDPLREFNRLYRKYDNICHELALAAGLSDSAFVILYYILEEGEGCSQGELCSRTFLTKQTIHSSIRKLRDEGFLTLEPGPGRDLGIRLTPAGRQLAQERILPVMELENAALQAMDPGERQALMNLTAQYLSLFEEKAGEHLRRPPSRRTKPPSL